MEVQRKTLVETVPSSLPNSVQGPSQRAGHPAEDGAALRHPGAPHRDDEAVAAVRRRSLPAQPLQRRRPPDGRPQR